jgi:hypothetical protein
MLLAPLSSSSLKLHSRAASPHVLEHQTRPPRGTIIAIKPVPISFSDSNSPEGSCCFFSSWNKKGGGSSYWIHFGLSSSFGFRPISFRLHLSSFRFWMEWRKRILQEAWGGERDWERYWLYPGLHKSLGRVRTVLYYKRFGWEKNCVCDSAFCCCYIWVTAGHWAGRLAVHIYWTLLYERCWTLLEISAQLSQSHSI